LAGVDKQSKAKCRRTHLCDHEGWRHLSQQCAESAGTGDSP
jgi:hypothetical protein